MADITVNDLTELAANPAANDVLPIWQVSTSQYKKITATNLFPFTVTGGGTIATGGFTFTVPKTGTGVVGTGTAGRVAEFVTDQHTVQASTLAKTGAGVLTLSASGAFTFTVPKTGTGVVGSGTIGRIAEWVTDANTMQASTLVKSGAGVLTLSADSTYTLTVPATGTAALLATIQTFSAAQTFGDNATFNGTILVNKFLTIPIASTLTVASDTITVTASSHLVDTQAAAASDDLSTINGGVTTGQILILRTVTSSRDVVLKHNIGNIFLRGAVDLTLNATVDVCVLMLVGANWIQIGGGNNV